MFVAARANWDQYFKHYKIILVEQYLVVSYLGLPYHSPRNIKKGYTLYNLSVKVYGNEFVIHFQSITIFCMAPVDFPC